MERICNRCGQTKSGDNYGKNRGTCRACLSEQKQASTVKRIAALAPKTCPSCNKEFRTAHKVRKDGYAHGTYCSHACRSTGERATRVYKNCPICQGEYWHWPSHNQLYCGKKCYSKACEDKVTVACAQCAKMIQKKPVDVKRMRRSFCGVECNKAFKMGPNHPNYIHGITHYPRGYNWSTVRKKALVRDGHTCQRCGAHKDNLTAKQRRLEVHHIVPFSFFMTHQLANNLTNLVTYCHACHWIAERKGKAQRAKRQMVLFAS